MIFIATLIVLPGLSHLFSSAPEATNGLYLVSPPTRFDKIPDGTYQIKPTALIYNGRRPMSGNSDQEYCFVSFRLPDGLQSPSLAPIKILVSAFPGDPQVRVFHDTSDVRHIELIVPPDIYWANEIPEHQLMRAESRG